MLLEDRLRIVFGTGSDIVGEVLLILALLDVLAVVPVLPLDVCLSIVLGEKCVLLS